MIPAKLPRYLLVHKRRSDALDETRSQWRRLTAAMRAWCEEYRIARAAERRIDVLIRMHEAPKRRRAKILEEFYAEPRPGSINREADRRAPPGAQLRSRPVERWGRIGAIGVGAFAIAATLSASPAFPASAPRFAECGRFFGYVEFDHDCLVPALVWSRH